MTDSIYRRLRDQHVAAVLELRYCPTERQGIQRLLRDGVIERNSPTESIAPRQMSLALGLAVWGSSSPPPAARPGSHDPTRLDQPSNDPQMR